jgi:hypothetical protein
MNILHKISAFIQTFYILKGICITFIRIELLFILFETKFIILKFGNAVNLAGK